MITNYYTLRLIARDLHRRFADFTISQIFTQHRNELVITCTRENDEGHIVISCEPARNYILCREEFPRARRNSVDLFPEIIGARIQEIHIHPSDRQMIITANNPDRLVVQLFGSKANVLLVDGKNIIRDAFLKPKKTIAKQVEEKAAEELIESVADLRNRLKSEDADLGKMLKRCFPQFGSEVTRELLHRANLTGDISTSALSDQEMQRLFDVSQTVRKQLTEHALPRLYYEDKAAKFFSIIPLGHLNRLRSQEFDSVHKAIRTFLGASYRQHGFEEEYKRLVDFLRQVLAKAERTLTKIAEEEESLARASSYEAMGKILMANLASLHKGMKRVEFVDMFSQSREVLTIPLDPALPPVKNAERYFEKAKKIRHGIVDQAERKEELHQRVATARELLERLESVDDGEVYKKFLDNNREQLVDVGFKLEGSSKAKQHEQVPFRVFTVVGGFQVWAGKSSENNDLLTMKYSKPHDLWFHARGSSGSHVVLKVGTGKGEPSKQAIQQAASIAAYYSKMKNARLVPVAMTERKYVRKPKGAPVGTVTLDREKTIFAEPKLPEF